MAQVKGFEHRPTRSQPHPTNVVCYHQVVDTGRKTYVQLTTFGSPFRETRPKNSQTLQFDEKAAAELIKILRSAFPSLQDGAS